MQCVGGDHRSGEVEVDQQRLEGGDLFWGSADLLLGQHGTGGVVHRGEQVDLALAVVGCAAGAAEGLAVDRDRPSAVVADQGGRGVKAMRRSLRPGHRRQAGRASGGSCSRSGPSISIGR